MNKCENNASLFPWPHTLAPDQWLFSLLTDLLIMFMSNRLDYEKKWRMLTTNSQSPSDVFQLLHLSSQRSKTQTLLIWCYAWWRKKAANPSIHDALSKKCWPFIACKINQFESVQWLSFRQLIDCSTNLSISWHCISAVFSSLHYSKVVSVSEPTRLSCLFW